MRVSLNWLQDFIDISDLKADEIAERLDLTGTAVENVFEEGAGLDRVIVAQIKKIRPHPQADRLVLCDVYTGVETVQIVCGAKNMEEGDKVALVLPGALLPNGMKIKKASIRGEQSAGMLASDVELGLGEEAAGIMVLDDKFKPGERLDLALGLKDTILELEITPNRPDSMSMIGVAREVGAIFQRDYKVPSVESRVESRESKKAEDVVSIEIKNTELCPRYIAKIVTDVTVGTSPAWLKKRLASAGARPINNLVDITNYILFETGQPLHAFDYELLEGGQIIVRQAKSKEKITTLDDIERSLDSSSLVIADKKKAVALAGVMGGTDTEVNDQTKIVLLESAYFNPQNIGATSRKLGLISESSIRFERGVDPNQTSYAADRAAQLMQELAGGQVLKGSVDVYPKSYKLRKLKIRQARSNSILGIDLSVKKMASILGSLELEVNARNSEIEVGVPTFRPDLEREIDLIEEVSRLYGLNNIESTLPKGTQQVGRPTKIEEFQQYLRNILIGYGLKEAVTYSFIDSADLKNLPQNEQKAVSLKNPISAEQSVLRTSLLPGLLNSLLFNVARQQENVQLFEMGTVFMSNRGLPDEKKHLGMILSGSWTLPSWHSKGNMIDFYDAKGIVQKLVATLKIPESLQFKPLKHKLLNPQRSFSLLLAEDHLGVIGEFHPSYAEENNLLRTAYAELDLELLLKYRQLETPFQKIPAYPAIMLDVALVVDKKIKHAEVVRSIEEMGHDLLKNIRLFDIYEGKGIEPGKKSMAYSLTYQSMERTLKLEEAQKIHTSILKNLKKDLSATIR